MKIVYTIENWTNRVFTPKYNPFYYLGTICFFLLVLIVISGVYLFIFYRTGSPYETVQGLTVNQWYIGGIMRSMHRYASDGLIIFLILHLLREFLLGRYRQWRWLSWVSGSALLIVSIVLGIIGYFLVWDEKALLIALKTAQLLDDIPIFIEPPPRTLLSAATMSQMLFFILLLAHIGITLVGMSILAGIHVSKTARPTLKPPRAIIFVILIFISLLSLIVPATSAPPVNMDRVPVDVPLDWFYLFIYPLASILPKGAFWFTAIGSTMLLFIAPWLGRSKRLPVAQISERCVGCEQCNKDCPYEAIRMVPRKDGRPYLLQAEVIASRCASCGICVASCESKGPDLPDRTMDQIEEEITKLLCLAQRHDGKPNILGLICEKSVNLDEVVDIENRCLKGIPNAPIVTLPCAGMIHHRIIEHALESGADGVFVCGCQTKECHYREGSKWLQARLKGERAPVLVLKGAVNYSRIRAYWLSPPRTNDLISGISLFQEELRYASEC